MKRTVTINISILMTINMITILGTMLMVGVQENNHQLLQGLQMCVFHFRSSTSALAML